MAKFCVAERDTSTVVQSDVFSKEAAIDKADELHKETGKVHEVWKISIVHASSVLKEAEIEFG